MAERILKGIAWDHERGHGCLARTADAFTAEHPGIRVEWSVRSLRDFGEGPIDRLADTYDFIVVDHPFSGHAGRSGALIDLRPLFKPDEITALETNAVGKSTISYQFGDAIYALPTDAAAQIASYRPDLLDRLDSAVPQTHAEVLALAKKARAAGVEIATPACAIDAMCLVLTFAANLGAPLGPDEAAFFTPELLDTVLGHVEELVAASDPRSLGWNPIQMYDEMSAADGIVYCPYAFGYSNYARLGRTKPILAANIAGPGPDPRAGSLLGGAGCAITRSCTDLEAAVAYMRWLHRPEFQAGAYFEAGGQPGLRNAWTDPAVNAAAQGFFANSLETLDKAYLRPRWDGFIPFFEPAGKTINARLKGEITRADTIERLRTLYDGARAERA